MDVVYAFGWNTGRIKNVIHVIHIHAQGARIAQ